jgi:hypothetical protein
VIAGSGGFGGLRRKGIDLKVVVNAGMAYTSKKACHSLMVSENAAPSDKLPTADNNDYGYYASGNKGKQSG